MGVVVRLTHHTFIHCEDILLSGKLCIRFLLSLKTLRVNNSYNITCPEKKKENLNRIDGWLRKLEKEESTNLDQKNSTYYSIDKFLKIRF